MCSKHVAKHHDNTPQKKHRDDVPHTVPRHTASRHTVPRHLLTCVLLTCVLQAQDCRSRGGEDGTAQHCTAQDDTDVLIQASKGDGGEGRKGRTLHNSVAHEVDGVGVAAGNEYARPSCAEDGSKPVADLFLCRFVAKGEEDHVGHHVAVQVEIALLAEALLERVDDALLVQDPDVRDL